MQEGAVYWHSKTVFAVVFGLKKLCKSLGRSWATIICHQHKSGSTNTIMLGDLGLEKSLGCLHGDKLYIQKELGKKIARVRGTCPKQTKKIYKNKI
jgi:hypothetical protein